MGPFFSSAGRKREMKETVIKLGAYKGIRVPKLDRTVSDEEMQIELDRAAKCAERIYEKEAAEIGDCVVVDFEGYMDGVTFDGGTDTDCPIELGSGAFIPGFEDQLVGAGKGDRIDVKVTYPDDYLPETLAGKDAVFKVSVKSVHGIEIPELTDEIISKVSEQNTIEEFKEFVTGEILKKREADYNRQKEDFVVATIVEASEVHIPEEMIKERAEQIRSELEQKIRQAGKTVEQYLQANAMSREDYQKFSEEDAKMMLEGQAVLDAIAGKEGFDCSKEELEAEIQKLADLYNMKEKDLRSMMGVYGEDMLKADVKSRKAIDFVLAECIEM